MFGIFVRFFGFLLLIMGLLTPAHAGKRVALVVGNSAYTHAAPLRNPKNDADAIATVLEKLGFEVVKGTDLTHRGFARSLSKFSKALYGADVALLFYAGHGLQVNGSNYLAPVDAQLEDEASLSFEAVPLKTILSVMERRRRTNIVLLDACRDNPLARNLARGMGTRSTAIGRGLAREETGIGTLVAFATQPGNVALDGEGDHSPFATALIEHIETPGLDIAALMRRVRLAVIDATERRQVPWSNSSLTGSFMFNDKSVVKAKPKAVEAARAPQPVEAVRLPRSSTFDKAAIDLAFWQSVKETGTREAYETYLERFPKGAFEPVAKLQLGAIKRSEIAQAKQQAQLNEALRKQAEAETAKRKTEAAKREKALTELQRKQKSEREKLAEERDALAKKLAAMEAEAKARAEWEKAATEVAALQHRNDPGSADTPVAAELNPRDLALALQTELKRVGCEPGRLDGQWGRKGQAALTRFNRYANLALTVGQPTLQALDAIKEKKTRICPLPVAKPRPKPVKKKAVSARAPVRKKRKSNFKSMTSPEQCAKALSPSAIGGGAGGC